MDKKWPSHILKDSLVPYFKSWQKILDMQEIGNVFFLPGTDRIRATFQFMDWLKENNQPLPQYLDLVGLNIEDHQDFERIKQSNTNQFLIIPGENLLQPDQMDLLIYFLDLQQKQQTSFLIFYELLPFALSEKLPLSYNHSFWQNQLIHPLYNRSDVFKFLQYLENKWSLKISASDKEQIYNYCGGYLWLIKETIRQIKQQNFGLAEIFRSSAFGNKVDFIWNHFDPIFQSAIKQKSVTAKISSPQIEAMLAKFNLFNPELKEGLPQFLMEKCSQTRRNDFQTQGSRIIFQNQDISLYFSLPERKILSLLFNPSGQIITRQQIAQAIWGNRQDLYSEWAIDQAIYRLRIKLQQNSIPYKIKTARGRGYVSG